MAKDLTQGRIMPMLIKFTIPLILGNIFQLTYNAVDSIIVGRFVGKEALAAVGICNPITTLIILFLNGLCMGASILMGNYFGGKKMDTLSRQISTTMISGMIFSFALPLYFLIISAVLNVFGDLFFVVVLKAGSNGCAVATVVSEALCCVFCMIYIKFKVPILCLGKKWLVFDRSLLKKTISYGWASAMQQATVQLGKIGIQAIINTMGVSVSAAFAVVNRIDDYAYTPEQNIAHGMTAMMAQNKGAGRDDRVIKGFKAGIILEIIYGIFIFFICFVFARPLMKLFTSDTEVIRHGVIYLKLISVMYILPAITNGIQGYFRGIGDLKITLLSSFINMGVRVLAAIPLVFALGMGIEALPFSYLAGWIGMLIAEIPLLVKNYRAYIKSMK